MAAADSSRERWLLALAAASPLLAVLIGYGLRKADPEAHQQPPQVIVVRGEGWRDAAKAAVVGIALAMGD